MQYFDILERKNAHSHFRAKLENINQLGLVCVVNVKLPSGAENTGSSGNKKKEKIWLSAQAISRDLTMLLVPLFPVFMLS